MYLRNDLEGIRKVRYSQLVFRINEPTVSRAEVLQGGCNMEGPSPPERVAAVGRDDDRESVRDDLGLDDEWEHHRVCKGGRDRRSIEACMHSVRAPSYCF